VSSGHGVMDKENLNASQVDSARPTVRELRGQTMQAGPFGTVGKTFWKEESHGNKEKRGRTMTKFGVRHRTLKKAVNVTLPGRDLREKKRRRGKGSKGNPRRGIARVSGKAMDEDRNFKEMCMGGGRRGGNPKGGKTLCQRNELGETGGLAEKGD